MAGHSKWANIQHRKGRQDKKRAKLLLSLLMKSQSLLVLVEEIRNLTRDLEQQ